jgi:hypothetical protein
VKPSPLPSRHHRESPDGRRGRWDHREDVAARLLTGGHDIDGREAWTLTPTGVQVATQMAMSNEEDAFAMFDALLDAAEAET